MTATSRIPETTREGTSSAAARLRRGCGCALAPATRTRGRYVVERCAEGRRLWEVLRSARDEMQDAQRCGGRKGHKARIDAFARARDEHARHVGIGA